MSLRFLSDQCVPFPISQSLRQKGHEVTLLRDVLPPRSPDPVVIAKAQEISAVLLSLNGDFADIVTYPPSKYQGIVSFQLHNHPEAIPSLLRQLFSYLDAHPNQFDYRGVLLIVEPHRVRIRH